MNVRYRIAGGLLFLIVLITIWFWYKGSQWRKITLDSPPLSFILHNNLISVPSKNIQDEENSRVEIMFRAIQTAEESRPMLVNIKKEKGLRIVTSLTRVEMLAGLLRNMERAYPQRFPGYKKEGERTFEQGGKKSAEIYFTYKSPAGEIIKQRLMVIEYDGGTAIYFSAQSKQKDFDSLNKKYFNKIFKSVKF